MREARTASSAVFKQCQSVLPYGVSSPMRTFDEVKSAPIVLDHGEGVRVFDVDGNAYVDFMCGLGPTLLGHGNPAIVRAVTAQISKGMVFGTPSRIEADLAGMILEGTPGLDRVRFVCSGTEALMSCLRLARGHTRRPRYLKFAGSYHGHSDTLMATGASTRGDFYDGIEDAIHHSALVAPYNDIAALDSIFEQHGSSLAAVVVEPVASNMSLVPPIPGFLQALRQKCDASGALLIFDEVVTGFRFRFGSVGPLFDVVPDFVAYGKIIGGGMPIGAYSSKSVYLEQLRRRGGGVFQGGTFSGNPVSMAAGKAMLEQLQERAVYSKLDLLGELLETEIRSGFARASLPFGFQRFGSLASLILVPGLPRIENAIDADRQDARLFAEFHQAMCQRGFLLAPSVSEPIFLSPLHSELQVTSFARTAVTLLSELTRGRAH